MKSRLLRCVAFVIIFLMIFIPASNLFVKAYNRLNVFQKDYYYALEKDSVDVLYLGGSTVWTGIQPMIVWRDSQITGFNMGSSVQMTFTAYHTLKEALKTQSPSVVVLDAHPLFWDYDVDDSDAEPFIQFALYSIVDKEAKKDAVDDLARLSQKNALYIRSIFWLPYIRYSQNWNEIGPLGIIRLLEGETTTVKQNHMGTVVYTRHDETLRFDPSFMTPTDSVAEHNAFEYEYFMKSVNLCRENNIEVVVVSMPFLDWSYEKYNRVQELCVNNNLIYYDLNLYIDDIGINPSYDFADSAHLNLSGANKVSSFFADKLKDMVLEGAGSREEVRAVWDKAWDNFANEYKIM